MANQYKIFQKGISFVPKAASLDGPYNSVKGDIELLSSTNKLYFYNGTINDPIVQENVTATLANKTLTAPVINNATADTITGIAGGPLTLQSASNQNFSIQAQGTGVVTLESLTINGSNVSASSDIVVNQTGSSKTYFQVTGTNVVRVDADGIAFLTQDKAKFYDADNSNYVGINAPATVPSDYTITLPANSPTANTALVWDGTTYKWGAAGGADSSGANDDILATTFRARILDSFDDAASASSSTVNSAATTATHVPANQLYTIQYDNTTISNANTVNPTLAVTPTFLAVGDVIILGTTVIEVRKVTALSPLTIESAFSTASGPCTVSQTVSSKELYGSAFDGASISSAFSASSFSDYLVDYQDSTTAIYTPNVTPLVGYSASQDNITWSAKSVRPTLQTDQISSLSFASPGTAIYVRLFANVTVGSGSVNLLEYRAYMQKSPAVSSGVLNQAYARLDGSLLQSCTLGLSGGGKTQVTLGWQYSNGVNTPAAFGTIDVYINGQFIPRQNAGGTLLTSGAFYKEISSTVIELDSNYSATPYAIQIIQRQPVGNFTTSSGSSSSSGGSGLKNYLTTYNNNTGNGNFETGDTTGWSLFNTTLTSLIPTGSITSGAASINTFLATATTPLAGIYSLSVGGSAGITAGQGFISSAFTIDREDRAKVLTFNFSYEVVSGTAMNFSGTSSNTWAVYIYDTSASAWIQPAGVYNIVQSSGAGYATGTFQTTSTSSQYRIALVCINAVGSAVSMRFDDFFVGPQVSVNAPAMSDWTSYTPTLKGTTGDPNTGTGGSISGRWRRVGDSIEVQCQAVAGTSPAQGSGSYYFTLPSGYILDTSKISYIVGSENLSSLGSAVIFNSGVQGYVGYPSPVSGVTNGLGMAVASTPIGLNSPSATWWSSGDSIQIDATVPIVGWSSNSVMSNDTDTRVVCATVNTSSSSIGTGDSKVTFTNIVNDTHGAYSTSTGLYTVPVSGFYEIKAFLTISSLALTTGQAFAALIWKAGVASNPISVTWGNGASNSYRTYGSTIIYCNAGDTLGVYANSSVAGSLTSVGNAALNHASFERLSGPAVIAATESVYASYYNNLASFAASPTVPINFNTAEFDSHNAVTPSLTAWKFTTPISGTYEISTYVYGGNPGTSVTFYIYKNQASVGTATKVITFQQGGTNSSGSCLMKLNAGDFIDMRPDVARNINGGALNTANCSYIQIKRIGN